MNSNKLISRLFPLNFQFRTMAYVKREKACYDQIPVETDCNKLVSEVCGSNFLAEGGENIKIKPDSEYPDWLWTIHIGKPLELSEMDPNTVAYWNKVRKINARKNWHLLSIQPHKTVHK